jgi:hypothetical protein
MPPFQRNRKSRGGGFLLSKDRWAKCRSDQSCKQPGGLSLFSSFLDYTLHFYIRSGIFLVVDRFSNLRLITYTIQTPNRSFPFLWPWNIAKAFSLLFCSAMFTRPWVKTSCRRCNTSLLSPSCFLSNFQSPSPTLIPGPPLFPYERRHSKDTMGPYLRALLIVSSLNLSRPAAIH